MEFKTLLILLLSSSSVSGIKTFFLGEKNYTENYVFTLYNYIYSLICPNTQV